jgi:hypothetical protein
MTQQEFIERYQFSIKDDNIGGGSFGTVYKAYDTILDREVEKLQFITMVDYSVISSY